MKIPSEETYYYYSITCLSAPFLGILSGGAFFSSLGGYNSPKAFTWALGIGCFALILAVPIPISTEKWLTYVSVWLLLFVGAFIMPSLTGIMLNTVPEARRSTANSIATAINNLCGYLPAPFIYGAISEIGKGKDDPIFWDRVAMGVLMLWTIVTAVFIIAGYILF